MRILLEKIRYKIKETSAITLIKVGLFLNWPWLAVAAFWLASGKVNPKCKSQYTVLCMGRSIFVEDVKAMAAYGNRIKYVIVWRTYLQKIYEHFINGQESKKITEENYHTHDFCKKGKQDYYLYLKRMFPLLRRALGFDAVLGGNFGYLDQQELARVCEEAGVPFIVLHKEGLVRKGDFKTLIKFVEGKRFIGSRILLYNSMIRDAYIEAKISGIKEENAIVVGVPRLDHYFLEKIGESGEKQIVLFSFWSTDKFFFIGEEIDSSVAQKRVDDFHRWVMEFALRHPDFKVIIKTKVATHYVDYVDRVFKDNFKEKIDNLIITNSADPKKLIKGSAAVLGFSSTTLMEAIMAKKIIISPYFSDLIKGQPADHFFEYPNLINYAKSYDEMEKIILNFKDHYNYTEQEKIDFLKSYLYMPDGKASFRAEEAIIKAIEESAC
ncbi:MAG: hypothetical protein PHF50_02730 [Patescibacteria group bacterium]|nr:hypothetical protein [Patescibacteria group bacterium]